MSKTVISNVDSFKNNAYKTTNSDTLSNPIASTKVMSVKPATLQISTKGLQSHNVPHANECFTDKLGNMESNHPTLVTIPQGYRMVILPGNLVDKFGNPAFPIQKPSKISKSNPTSPTSLISSKSTFESHKIDTFSKAKAIKNASAIKSPPVNKGKRPMNSFFQYRSNKLAEIRANHGVVSNPEIATIAAAMWKAEPESVRNAYKEQSLRNYQEYFDANPDFVWMPKYRGLKNAAARTVGEMRNQTNRKLANLVTKKLTGRPRSKSAPASPTTNMSCHSSFSFGQDLRQQLGEQALFEQYRSISRDNTDKNKGAHILTNNSYLDATNGLTITPPMSPTTLQKTLSLMTFPVLNGCSETDSENTSFINANTTLSFPMDYEFSTESEYSFANAVSAPLCISDSRVFANSFTGMLHTPSSTPSSTPQNSPKLQHANIDLMFMDSLNQGSLLEYTSFQDMLDFQWTENNTDSTLTFLTDEPTAMSSLSKSCSSFELDANVNLYSVANPTALTRMHHDLTTQNHMSAHSADFKPKTDHHGMYSIADDASSIFSKTLQESTHIQADLMAMIAFPESPIKSMPIDFETITLVNPLTLFSTSSQLSFPLNPTPLIHADNSTASSYIPISPTFTPCQSTKISCEKFAPITTLFT
ncbi:hypothetical protein BATDEDRAFT_28269 [Batrachochytrium dendrobatidis JAM81]|uniref:HMG box domain-containing protein n=1 Tax=Batrachochytrium dendrobatidis (strain JAM81 / FGSC 10211) TaxID=684364 RepID=F4PDI5_BATDJ|nr:uncharacterized protein BATDEDRAFT_28269 [Batrachochytrium dendrobatidis JAM81]EGF76685.1 hypothetical protein BATDEDRAFT_28269 [Batrachochytrium dendrobatidis JAM81]|eukprot:XP_006682609.1 hypothetical protein BATDEDRAFT_28269 [Batrachochytrium dendrobatidis JAM81]